MDGPKRWSGFHVGIRNLSTLRGNYSVEAGISGENPSRPQWVEWGPKNGWQDWNQKGFLNSVLILCEWWYRIRSPSIQHIKKALKHRTSLDAYDPFRGQLIWPGEDTRGVPLLINRYVDHHIEKFWDEGNSALSRNILKSRMDQLAKEMDCPFRIATLEPISRQKGGYGWQAPG